MESELFPGSRPIFMLRWEWQKACQTKLVFTTAASACPAHADTHKQKGIIPSFVLSNSIIVFFSVCTLTCIRCSISACVVLPTVTDVHMFPHGLCTHQIFTIPLWHLAQVQMIWIGKRWLFPLLSLHVDLHWVGDFPAYHTHCLCFVLLIY